MPQSNVVLDTDRSLSSSSRSLARISLRLRVGWMNAGFFSMCSMSRDWYRDWRKK